MKVYIHTLGCKVNQYESDALALNLEKVGYEITKDISVADLVVINTCAVTNEAERKSRQMVAKLKSQSPNAKIIVMGCASEHNYKQFENLCGVGFVYGAKNKSKVAQFVNQNGHYILEQNEVYDEENSRPSKVRAQIKIQDGCNNFCAYCLIPYLRGRSRSRDMQNVLNEIESVTKSGEVKEVVLTGINITDYKQNGKLALKDLVQNVCEKFPDVRVRLGSIEESLITEDFLKAVSQFKNFCPHFHLSLQSGSDSVLRAMNRHYTTAEFLEVTNLIKKYFTYPTITTDIIVGFPTETEENFEETLSFAEKVGFSFVHIFVYSPRSNTPAQKMKQLDGKIKKSREEKLKSLNTVLMQKHFEKLKNTIDEMLVEENKDGYFVGYTKNYIRCFVKSDININEVYKVRLISPYEDGMIAKVIK